MKLLNKKVLVIGGAGTLGKVLVSKLLKLNCKVTVMSRDEEKHYWMKEEYSGNKNITFEIGDIRNYTSVNVALKSQDIVVNCAAMKQVLISEYNPMEAVLTNVIGAGNIVSAIKEHNYSIDTIVSISSDKACKPFSVMGMTKALSERIIISGNKVASKTRFICLRCGNFVSSNGSVMELFNKQIKNGGPVTITHPDMLRFFVSLDEVCDMFFTALKEANPGDIYVTNVKKIKILDLAKRMIGGLNIKIKFIGIRPGEKLCEELISEYEQPYCIKRGKYRIITSLLK